MRPVFVFLRLSMVFVSFLGVGACSLLAASDDELMGGSSQPDASLGGSGGSGGATTDAGLDVEAPDVAIPDGGCLWPNKVCPPPPSPGGECVDFDDPSFGCAQDTCAPCDPGLEGEPGCLNNMCIVKGCGAGFFSCDGDPQTGCETNIWSLENCGVGEQACGKPCAPARAQTATCNQGKCEIVQCEGGWADCNNNPDDGCETNLRTIEDCGKCFELCTVQPPSNPTCASGVCKSDVCPPGKADCDANEQDCETDLTTPSNCGACGLVCSGPNVATWACNDVGGVRTCQVVTCDPGWGNCDGDHTNGCERDLGSSVDHCGACNATCSANNTLSRACSNSLCVPTCASGFGNCDGNKPGTTDNGCETIIRTLTNCGACGVSCSRANATATCATGICSIASCNAGYGNCDGQDPNGCEANTNTSATHCGGCGTTCSSNNVPNPTCGSGVCNGACASGFADCNGNKRTDGCETNTNTMATHCGGCGQACSANNIPTPTCTGGSCTGTCAAGFADCNSNKLTDGCETNTKFSVTNCGFCTNVCPAPPHATATCEAGTCSYVCTTGFADCDDYSANGCECPTSAGFTCVLNACNCLNSATCTNGGFCDGEGRCICSGTNCALGEICVGPGTCGSP